MIAAADGIPDGFHSMSFETVIRLAMDAYLPNPKPEFDVQQNLCIINYPAAI